ncbi:MAG: Smr/MutS family protein [Paludibacteraceae bacterium]|nr:Smr/MutS family protein [Paludibacteraceae bacterium]
MTYPNNIEQKIDFGVIREQLYKGCSSSLGRREVDAMVFSTDYQSVLHRLREAEEMVHVVNDASLQFPRGEINDLRESLTRVRVEGLYLDESELSQLRKSIDYAAQLERFFLGLDALRFPQLRTLPTRTLKNLSGETTGVVLQPVLVTIDRAIDMFGQLRDSASPELHRIRRELSQAQGTVSSAVSAILRRAQAAGLVDKDATPTLREGRLVLPIPASARKKIGGIVHDESATGKTVFIEPQEVVEANNRIRSLESEQARERLRILHEITNFVRPQIPQIMQTQGFLAHVDFILAKATLAKRLNAISPQFVDYPMVDIREARHAVLYLRFADEGKTVVPLTMRLDKDGNRILVISGPNAGGKSVCLKTVALCQYMLQCGLPVPVSEASTMGLFDRLMIDIGDEQSIEDDLSTYSSHLRNMKAFVRYADEKTLFLIDEFGTGTEPLIGGSIAEAVLGKLNEQGAFGVVTTHYTNLKHFAEQAEGVVNGAMLYDRGQLRPLFQLSIGQAGSSFAIEIAKQTGLPEDIIQRATELVGEEHIDYDKQLQDIARDKRYWENKRQNIRQREKHLEEKIAYYESEIAGLKAKKKAVLQEAKDEAADILSKTNATIERTIREIKESKADKGKTQAARAKVEKLKQQVEPAKMEKPVKKRVLKDFRELKPLSKSMPSSQPSVVNTIRQHKLSFERTLDLRGMRADEALETFIAYLDDAIMVNAGTVSILHGTGTGALKQVVRDHLVERNKALRKRNAGEIGYHDGDPDRGGAGITIVDL